MCCILVLHFALCSAALLSYKVPCFPPGVDAITVVETQRICWHSSGGGFTVTSEPSLNVSGIISRVGRNRTYAPYLTVYLVISLPKYRICTVYIWFWTTFIMGCL